MSDNKKVLKGLNFPGLEGTYYVPEAVAVEEENGYIDVLSIVSDTVEVENLDATLTKEGFAADAKAVGEALAEKAPKSYILHGTIDTENNVTLTDFDWDELVAAITSEEHIYVAARLVDETGRIREYALAYYLPDDDEVGFAVTSDDGRTYTLWLCVDGAVEYYSHEPKTEWWTFTLEGDTTVKKQVFVL